MGQFKISSETMWDDINDKFGKKGGVYILKCFDSENTSTPLPVNRFLKKDSEGILYIGMANEFLDRVPNLTKSISPNYKSSSHACGVRYKSNQSIQDRYPFENLYLELIGSDNPRVTESDLLKKYEEIFGELPPLNRSM